jgi:SPP1 family predicted phage head-tail adaptor
MSFDDLLINTCTIERYAQASIVIGTDGLDYHCIKAHTAGATNKPITGVDYATYWSLTGGSGAGEVWVTGTSYVKSFNNYGQPVKVWSTLHAAAACRHMSGKGREVKIGQEVVVVYDELLVKYIDVTEQDRVIIGGKTYQILSVVIRQDSVAVHNKHLYLEIVK